ncbi:hypothetical protein CERZMDRAFT_6488, partial [Cercospora zeae-maydis SCOH1-5]
PCVWRPPPMTDPTSQTRLLWIHADEKDEEIRCTVSIWDLEDAPELRAISYTLGPQVSRHMGALDSIDATHVEVRENGRFALWQARSHVPDSYIWIHYLCIDQTDQVAMMAKVYTSALELLA